MSRRGFLLVVAFLAVSMAAAAWMEWARRDRAGPTVPVRQETASPASPAPSAPVGPSAPASPSTSPTHDGVLVG